MKQRWVGGVWCGASHPRWQQAGNSNPSGKRAKRRQGQNPQLQEGPWPLIVLTAIKVGEQWLQPAENTIATRTGNFLPALPWLAYCWPYLHDHTHPRTSWHNINLDVLGMQEEMTLWRRPRRKTDKDKLPSSPCWDFCPREIPWASLRDPGSCCRERGLHPPQPPETCNSVLQDLRRFCSCYICLWSTDLLSRDCSQLTPKVVWDFESFSAVTQFFSAETPKLDENMRVYYLQCLS